uniref:[heparan sulfate]-glucosamine N-sulfotransferase n=1 Tax=Globodera rostochiensis TaxID=31243 RepID=A0A914HA25_GLORO
MAEYVVNPITSATKTHNYFRLSMSEEKINNGSTAGRILLLLQPDQLNSATHKSVENFIKYFKVPVLVESHLPGEHLLLELGGRARFSLLIFGDYRSYHLLSSGEKALLREFCARHSAGVISFLELSTNGQRIEFANFTVYGRQSADVEYWTRNESNVVECTLFKPTLSRLNPILRAENELGEQFAVALQLEERHVIFGAKPDQHWLIQIALLDAIAFLAPTIHNEDLERFVQIDIDDVFVGTSGSRLVADDVQSLHILQDELREHIANFSFTLGFSGYFFRHGDSSEIRGDEILVSNANKFHWFPHMWRHNHPHEFSNVGVSANLSYAVSPQHSGVYPVYQPLYDAWATVWSVRITSTEEYPHLRPASGRRAFVHGPVTVLPRQTCGLFTHTQFFHAYPDGVDHFLSNVFGGELFTSVLMNKFSIFMTHQQNFANDRLGAFTFLNLAKFVECWTNLRLRWTTPTNLAELYLNRFPQERTLLYTNPCDDPRHRQTMPSNFNCTSLKLPNLLILGPQKTGTTALGLFLSLHPNISTNAPISNSFEELQFFGGPNYARGVHWYAEQFANASSTISVLFEKSANYFDNPKVPGAVHALLPNAKLIVILSDPAQRAYSWFQHMRAHNNSAALRYSAEQLFANETIDDEGLTKLRRRCLWPGLYARHIDRWLDHFAPSQLLFVDGLRLRSEPYFVLSELFAKLQLPPLDGLHRLLRYSPEKGFYCAVLVEKTDVHLQQQRDHQRLRCLGRSKGRHYEPMPNRLRQHLETYFTGPNIEMRELFRKYHFRFPSFLQQN